MSRFLPPWSVEELSAEKQERAVVPFVIPT
jgi:hypothetical protein